MAKQANFRFLDGASTAQASTWVTVKGAAVIGAWTESTAGFATTADTKVTFESAIHGTSGWGAVGTDGIMTTNSQAGIQMDAPVDLRANLKTGTTSGSISAEVASLKALGATDPTTDLGIFTT